ncbi:MAG TPA: DUF167 domain-containing protein [Acidimicrobiales bacterium]|nr:DUF167 domain-containing protein [Acidimicrobiales bacterium]
MTDDLFEVEEPPPGAAAGDGRHTIVLRLHVQPGAGRAAVAGRRGDALHVRVAPPPADGRANSAAAALVADLLDVAPSAVEIVSGHKSRAKRVRVAGVDLEVARAAIAGAIDRSQVAAGRTRASGGRPGR